MSIEGIGVLVGVDESDCSQVALAWAAADAAARRAPLTIATVVDLPRLADIPLSTEVVDTAQRSAQRRLDAAVARAREGAGGVPVQSRVLTGDPAAELVRLATGAEEVVVGSHGTGRLGRLLIGAVGSRVAEHAPCPAVVVRGRPAGGPVVVGIDSSPDSEAALEYGFTYADRHGLPLVALHVYTPGAVIYPVMPFPAPPYPVEEELARIRAEAVRTAEQGVGTWMEKYPEVDSRTDVAEGGAAQKLVEASRTASLLVVGTRGHGGLAGMLLGSVSHAVLRHAHSPVVIAR
ncbi:MAG TPA: universal stress protein [Mycobacteriales bacterium]